MANTKSPSNNDRFFSFSLSQKRGIFILLCLIFFLTVGYVIISIFSSQTGNCDFTEFETQIKEYEKNLVSKSNFSQKRDAENTSLNKSHLTPFPFNPNTLSAVEWEKIGLKESQIKSIQRYISKGGRFYKKEDFKKMYCITASEYAVLEPYIKIPVQHTTSYSQTNIPKKELKIELNTADTTNLKELKGIGSTFANRIVKYRNLLGGFYSKNQLLEVWGFTPEMLTRIENSIIIDMQNIRKIDINTVQLEQLKKHPYIEYYIAKSIIKYRSEKGEFKTIDDLLKVNLLYEETFAKIKPYLIIR